jgi:hypothetical protein
VLTLARWLSWGEPAFGCLNFVSYSPGVAQSDKRRGFSFKHLLSNRLLTRHLAQSPTSLEFRQALTLRAWSRGKLNRTSPPWGPVVSSFPVQIQRIRAVPESKVALKAKALPTRIQLRATLHLSRAYLSVRAYGSVGPPTVGD